jgi:two-component system sensor histidine kinase AlgZ
MVTMKFMTSIKQNTSFISVALPDFRNMGSCLRILVIANLMGLAAAIVRANSMTGIWQEFLATSATLEPLLLTSLLVLYALYPSLAKLPYRLGISAVLGVELAVATLVWLFNVQLFGTENISSFTHWWLLTLMASSILLAYFNLRSRALSPALVEARLQALQARIRPHFLFNSINAVLSLIRDDPHRAETALEDLADLFRVLMADNRQLVPLETELALCRQYLDLEKLRLGHRLHIVWNINAAPEDALIPPLVLQPLLENAVYHGIEPVGEGGEIVIDINLVRDQVQIQVSNPYHPDGAHHSGNRMALENIRERLALHFDYEASLNSEVIDGQYQVSILLPYHK